MHNDETKKKNELDDDYNHNDDHDETSNNEEEEEVRYDIYGIIFDDQEQAILSSAVNNVHIRRNRENSTDSMSDTTDYHPNHLKKVNILTDTIQLLLHKNEQVKIFIIVYD